MFSEHSGSAGRNLPRCFEIADLLIRIVNGPLMMIDEMCLKALQDKPNGTFHGDLESSQQHTEVNRQMYFHCMTEERFWRNVHTAVINVQREIHTAVAGE